MKKAEEVVNEEVRACLLFSGSDKNRFAQLKRNYANDYLGRDDNYPRTVEKAVNLLGNYAIPYVRPLPRNENNVAFLQSSGRGGRGRGRGRGGQHKQKGDGPSPPPEKKTNKNGESHCFHCGSAAAGARLLNSC